jgi:hypothetical protein
MYINPFWAGVIATIFTEIGVLFALGVYGVFKRGKHYGKNE